MVMQMTAPTLREQTAKINALRIWLIRLEAQNLGTLLGNIADRLEAELLTIEDALGAEADALEPLTFRPTGAQWLAGLTTEMMK